MRALTIRSASGDAELVERPAPASGTGETLLDVIAAALNPVDCRIAAGDFYAGNPPFPYVPGIELVGRVRVSDRFPIGMLVWSSLGGLGTQRDGGLAERTVVRNGDVVPIVETVDPALAVGIGTPGLAAWIPMAHRVPVQPGDTVVILGATGAAGQVATQAARLLGAGTVIAVGRSETRLDRAMELGADASVVVRGIDQMADDLRDACGPRGATYVFDLMWSEPLLAALQVAAPHARVVHVGQSAGPAAALSSAAIRGKSLEIVGFSNFNVDTDTLQHSYLELLSHVDRGRVELDVERVPLCQSDDAWRRLKAGPGTKLVVLP